MTAYTITHTDGTIYTKIGEGTIDTSLGISLIGQNYRDYGQLIANNFLQILENQSNATPPINPQAGQLWWNSASKLLNVFDGNQFKPCSGFTVGTNTPIKPLSGEQWWDTSTNQLKVYNSTEWVVIGPLYQKGQLFSGILPDTVVDNNGISHQIATIQINGVIVVVISNDPTFYMPLGHEIQGLVTINPGMNLVANTSLTGTASNAERLGGIDAASYAAKTSAEVSFLGNVSVAGNSGITVINNGTATVSKLSTGEFALSSSSKVALSAGTAKIMCNAATGEITITNEPTALKSITSKQYVDSVAATINTTSQNYTDAKISALVAGSPINTLNALSNAISNDANYAINVTARLNDKANILSPTFLGTPRAPTPPAGDASTKLATTEFVNNLFSPLSSGTTVAGSILPTVDQTFDIGSASYRYRTIYGTAIQAMYADLAEKYVTDGVYLPGTVVVFGGANEVTVSDLSCDPRIAGVISTEPAYLMNVTSAGQAVALSGKVPCKVVGAVKKGDILVNSKFAGVATVLPAGKWVPGCVIGKSLETSEDTGIRLINIAVGRF